MKCNIEPSRIVSFECGTLILNLYHEVNPENLHPWFTNVAISKNTVKVVTNREKNLGEISFTFEQIDLIHEGIKMVKSYWETDRLPQRHILLECGCMIDWDKEEDHERPHPKYYTSQFHKKYGCKKHYDEGQYVLRYNHEDFPPIEIPYRHILLNCGSVQLWEDKQKNPRIRGHAQCLTHQRNCKAYNILEFNPEDFPEVSTTLSQE